MCCESNTVTTQDEEFGQLFKVISPTRKIKKIYDRQCKMFHLLTPHASTQNDPANVFPINAKYFSIYQTLLLQVGTETIRGCMHFLTCRDVNSNVTVWDGLIKAKIHRDGFRYSHGRINILATLSNCSIWNCENSRNTCSIISIGDFDENRFNLHLFSQRQDVETLLLRVFGLPDSKTGWLLGCYVVNVEDTGSLEKSVGKDSSKGQWRWLWSKYGKKIHHDGWLSYHVWSS